MRVRSQRRSTATPTLHWMWPAASRHAITRTAMRDKDKEGDEDGDEVKDRDKDRELKIAD